MPNGTLAPWFGLQLCDTNGNPLSGGKVNTYAAGTTTPLTTYSDVALTVANANPTILDSAGRAVFYLLNRSYKFVVSDSLDNILYTRDNVSAVPGSGFGTEILGTVAEAITANDVVFLSDGSGSRNAGQWYKADADDPVMSVTPLHIAFATAAIASGAQGLLRQSSLLSGFSGLTAGAIYYISSTAGGITATRPSTPAFARVVGAAVSTTELAILIQDIPRQDVVIQVTGNHTAVAGEQVIEVNSAGATTQTLFAAATANIGTRLTYKNIGAGVATVTRAGADTIDTLTTQALQQNQSLILVVTSSSTFKIVSSVGACDVQIFATTGANTWTKPPNAKSTRVVLIGAGGGGGSGRKGAAGGSRYGGGAAGGGGYSEKDYPSSILGATETVTVGAGGAGGAAVSANDTSGNAGVAGGDTSFGSWLVARGGAAGSGGTGANGLAGGGGLGLQSDGGDGGAGGNTDGGVGDGNGATTGTAFQYAFCGGCGGGGGAGISAADSDAWTGGAGGGYPAGNVLNRTIAGGAGGAGGGANPGVAGTSANTSETIGGTGGGGGGGNLGAAGGGVGGTGGLYGGGGGGGGAALNAVGNSGAGGAGRNGIAIVTTYL